MFNLFTRKTKRVEYTNRQLVNLAAAYLNVDEWLVELVAPMDGEAGHYGATVLVYEARKDGKANKRRYAKANVFFM